MFHPDRNPLSGLVEIDETAISHQTKEGPVAGGQGGRSHQGKLPVAGTVKIEGLEAGRIRLTPIDDFFSARHAAFRSLLAIATRVKPVTYKMLILPEAVQGD